jgi:hypothetical protein
MFLEPKSALLVIGQDGGYHIPEFLRMVHMGNMAKLMYHHIIQHSGWSVE